MMILIKDMKMPRDCEECRFSEVIDGLGCMITHYLILRRHGQDKPKWCALVEVPDIIQCKDCKYWDTSWQYDAAPDYHYCPLVDGKRDGNFYCAEAERK